MHLGIDNERNLDFIITKKETSLKQEAEIRVHTKRVMRIACDPESSFIMPISENAKYKIRDISTCESAQEEGLGRRGLKSYAVW